MKRQEKLLYLSWQEYGRLAYALAHKILKKRTGAELVIGIARGGVPLAMVIADELAVKMDIVNVKSYVGIGAGNEARHAPRILTTLTGTIRGRSVLIVDDLIEHGDTMKAMVKYISKGKPRKIITAVMFKKPWSKFEPDFYLRTVNTWVVFPWDKYETKRLMGARK